MYQWRTLVIAVGLCFVGIVTSARAQCPADSKWLPHTPKPKNDNPNSPDVDCPFYQAAWQHFLFAAQPDRKGNPAFFSYKNIEDLFGAATISRFLFPQHKVGTLSLAPRVAERPNDNAFTPQQLAVIGSDVFQAGLRGLLIDQRGHPIFYGIHVNKAFDDFLSDHKLKNPISLKNASDSLVFPKGVVELKSAWQIVDDANPPKNYIIARKASVPTLRVQNHKIIADISKPRTVTVALLALHVVFVLDGHPEFIWSTFEHVDPTSNIPDLTPVATVNDSPGSGPISGNHFVLFKDGSTADQINTAVVTDQAPDPTFDEATQTFKTTGGLLQTSIIRLFPASKSNTTDVDDEIQGVNDSITKLFAAKSANDPRRNYRLIGGVWLKNPLGQQGTFKLGVEFKDKDGQTTDDPNSVLQGEDRLSGMAMESFTQDQFPNCFSCHSTKAVTDDDTGDVIISPKLLNVSHVLSKFLSSQITPEPLKTQKGEKSVPNNVSPAAKLGFADVRNILDQAIQGWRQQHGGPPDLTGHGPSFKWDTKADLLAAVGHGKRLIQPEVIGNGKGNQANLVIDLRTGLPLRMPKGGPFLSDALIQKIEDWINAGCPD